MGGNDYLPPEKAVDGNGMAEKNLIHKMSQGTPSVGTTITITMKEAVQRHYKSLEIEERPIDIIRQGVIDENVCGIYNM